MVAVIMMRYHFNHVTVLNIRTRRIVAESLLIKDIDMVIIPERISHLKTSGLNGRPGTVTSIAMQDSVMKT